MSTAGWYTVAPSASRLTGSLRDIGYDFPTAVADIVDNSIAAGAERVEIQIEFDGQDSYVSITDDGRGMTPGALLEALRFGSRRSYNTGELGRYGLGLKTASLSQCRSLTVVTRCSEITRRTSVRMLDLDIIEEHDEWLIVDPGRDDHISRARAQLVNGTGTVVLWRNLDRALPEKRPEGGWARRRLDNHRARTVEHLGIVFHRFLEGTVNERPLVITVNGEKVRPWNPFAPDEPEQIEMPFQRFEFSIGETTGHIGLRRYILPTKEKFSALSEFERHSGPLNWNRQQGIYVYRAQRLVQWGGWSGIRGIDEHTKLARAAVDFDTDLDLAFHINVAKMRVTIPPQLRTMLEKPINELCIRADDAYRKNSRKPEVLPISRQSEPTGADHPIGTVSSSAGLALLTAAIHAGELDAWERIKLLLRRNDPEIAAELGLND